MDHSVEAYLRRLPTEKLEAFLQDYKNNAQYNNEIAVATQELSRRKEDAPAENSTGS